MEEEKTKGSLIVVEGVDGCGKATQSDLLVRRLVAEGHNARKISFPNYDKESSALVKMYLRGDFGKDASEVNAYIASTFYSVDRYATYKTECEEFYLNGGILVVDRYTQSNAIHQTGKIKDEKERDKFLEWLFDHEFNFYQLPRPDLVIFLDIHPSTSERLMLGRANKFTGGEKKDIHESDSQHLIDAYLAAKDLIDRYGWTRIDCVKDEALRDIEDIHSEIHQKALDVLKWSCGGKIAA